MRELSTINNYMPVYTVNWTEDFSKEPGPDNTMMFEDFKEAIGSAKTIWKLFEDVVGVCVIESTFNVETNDVDSKPVYELFDEDDEHEHVSA